MNKALIFILLFVLSCCSDEGKRAQEQIQQSEKKDKVIPKITTHDSIQDIVIIDSSSFLSQSIKDTINNNYWNIPSPSILEYYSTFQRKHPSVEEQSKGIKLTIIWVDSIQGDFSFIDKPVRKYNYVSFQTPLPDSLFELRIAGMKNDENEIIPDSLQTYLSLVDTTQHFSIYSEKTPYGGTPGIALMLFSKNNSTITGFSGSIFRNSMNFVIERNFVSAWTVRDIINSHGAWESVQELESGYMKIDRNLYKNGIIKAEFDFLCESSQNWKGIIYGKVE